MKLPDVFVELQKNSMEFFVPPSLPLEESVLSNTLKENPEEGYQCCVYERSYIACAALTEMIIDSALS